MQSALVAFAQANVQVALEAAPVLQTVMSYGVMQQANNNGSVQAVDSQNDGKGISFANMAATAGNIGQNIATADGKNVYFVQANLQGAGLDTAVTQDRQQRRNEAGEQQRLDPDLSTPRASRAHSPSLTRQAPRPTSART